MIYRFGPYTLDTGAHVFRSDQKGEIPLEPQVFALLALLAANPGQLISRERLVEEVWGGRIVSDSTIDARVAAARRAVGDDGKRQHVIQTVVKVGLRLVVPVDTVGAATVLSASARPPVRHAMSADGTRIAFATHGSGPPLLRGGHWLSHLELDWESPVWQPMLERLGRSFTVTRYDPRGTGLSERDPRQFDLDRLAEDMAAVADGAGLDRFPIFAASQAVPVSIRFAARWPERVSALILYGGFALGRHHRRSPQERAREETALTMIREGWGRSGTAYIHAFSVLYMPGGTPEQVDDMVRLQLASAEADTVIRLRQAIDRFDVRGELDRVTAPTLVVHARGDAVQPAEQGQFIASRIRGAGFRMLASDNHVPLPQDPAWEILMADIARAALPQTGNGGP